MAPKSINYIFILLIALSGCHNTLSEVGSGLLPAQAFDVLSIDTITLKGSTIKYDSLITSSTVGCKGCRLLVGYHVDDKLGATNSKSFFQLTAPGTYLNPITSHYQSLVLHLFRDKYYYYDTTQLQTINVYRVTKEVQLYNGSISNVDNFQIDKTAPPLGTITFNPRPNLKDSLEIPLSDALGQQLMTMIQQQDVNIFPANFPNFLFGLALIADSTQSRNFIGFMPSPTMRLYYHDDTTPPGQIPDKWISFTFAGPDFLFNKISADRSATKLSSLKVSTDQISSTKTDNEMYLQGGTGIAMRIDIPYLKNLNSLREINNVTSTNTIANTFQVTKALLTLVPIRSSNDLLTPQTPFPPVLDFDLVDSENVTLSIGYIPQVNLIRDQQGNPSYTADVTNFVNQEIVTTQSNVGNGLLVRLSADWTDSVNRLYLGDQKNYFFMKLKIYYITLTDQ